MTNQIKLNYKSNANEVQITRGYVSKANKLTPGAHAVSNISYSVFIKKKKLNEMINFKWLNCYEY